MATSELPARSGSTRPPAIDVSSHETPVAPPAPGPPATSDEVDVPRPPPRHLATDELITEGTRLAVGAVVATGRGLRAILERAVTAVERAAEDGGDEDDDHGSDVAALRAPGAPDNVMGALPTAALGASIRAQRQFLAAMNETRRRYGPRVTWMLEAPGVEPLYQRFRSTVFDLYREGAAEKEAGATLAMASLQEVSDEGLNYVFHHLDLNIITHGFDVTPLIENLDLNDVILSSTGGLATEALDNVRAQGVTVDDVISRITNRLFRRAPDAAASGPDGPYGVKEELPRWSGR